MKKLSFFLMAMLLTLCVTNAFGEVYFSDSFSNVGTGSNATVSSRTGWSSLTQCYGQYNSGLRIGSSKNAGSITKTAMSNISGTKNLKVTIYTAKYNKDGNSFTITATNGTITSVTGVGKLSAGTLTVSPTGNAGVTGTTSKATWTDSYKTEFIISGATSSTTIKFATNKRAILGPITIEDEAASGDDEIETVDLGDLLKWSATSATVTVGADDNEFPTLTNTNDVAVSYTSSTPATATIDASTGAITLVAAGTTTISAFYEGGDDAGEGKVYAAKTVSYTLTVKPAPLVIEPIEGGIIDILTHGNFGANSNSYANFTGKQAANDGHSTAVYAGRTARNGDATQYNVQLNTIDKGRIATTTTGGLAKRVYVRWASQTANTNNRALYIYGSNDAFTGGETTDPSTKIGIVTFTTGAEEAYADLTGDYKHILITGSGAIYMDEIQVTWVSAEGTVVTPTISGDAEFIESTEISISAEDGLKVYYTLDGTDPTNASTEYTAPFTVSATTTVKAVAYDGENASDIASQTFKKLQVLTCEEAADACKSTESADKYVIRGYVTNVKYAYNEEYKTATFWIADTKDGGQVLQAYSAKPVAEIDKAVKVGDYVEAIGNLKLYNETPEITNGTYTIIPAPVVNHTITVSANPAEAGTVTGGGEYEEGATATLTATANEGYEFVNWTENEVEVSTDAEYTFEVLADRALVANFKEAEPEGIEVVLENARKEVYLVWNRANFFGEHATYGEISVQINNYNGYGTYAEGVSSRIDGVKVNGSATFENKGETDLLTATLTDAEGTVYIIKAEVPTPKTYEVVATNATYVNLEGWSGAELTVNGLTLGEEELTLTVYWDGVGGSEEGYEASAGFEGSLQGMILVDKGEGDVLSFEGTLKDASDNSYIFDFEATPKAAETYTLTFEEMVIEPGQWDDNLHITAENTEYAIEFQLFGGKTKGYGEYGFTDDYPDVDEIYINSEYATMAEGTVANYYLNVETSLATIELTVVLGIDIYNITLTGQPLVNPEDIVPTDTINITMTKATIGFSQGMPKVAASSEEAELSIVLVGENPYMATVEDFSAASYLVTTAGSLTFLRGGLEIVEVGDVKIAYIGVLCSDHKWYNITLTTGTELPTALDNVDTTVAPAKAIVNGQLVIIKNGVQYNATGAVVK